MDRCAPVSCRIIKDNLQINQMKNMDFDLVPTGWPLCFRDECGQRDRCLRYQAGMAVPTEQLTATAVVPQPLTEAGCRAFHAIREERVAWGFTHLFDAVSHRDYAALRREVEQLLGSRYAYHRYHTGERKLREEQQRQIARLLAVHGYPSAPVFDHQAAALVFG